MPSPTVSIIIPSYNRAHLIEETLASVAAQTWTDYEVLVIDDGSKDNTEPFLRPWCERDSRICYVRQANGGVSSARNHGLRLARGEFIAFLDSDDLWSPWKLKLQVELLQALPQSGMLWTNMDTIDDRGKVLTPNYLRVMYSAYNGQGAEYPFRSSTALAQVPGINPDTIPEGLSPQTAVRSGSILKEIVFGNLVHTSTVMLRKSVADRVGPFNESLRHGGEDYDFHLRTCALTAVSYLDVSSMQYRTGMSDQITCTGSTTHFARAYLATVTPFLRVPGLLSLAEQRQILAVAYRWLGEQLLEDGCRTEALSSLLRSEWHQPLSRETLKLLVKSCLPLQTLRRVRSHLRSLRSTDMPDQKLQPAKN